MYFGLKFICVAQTAEYDSQTLSMSNHNSDTFLGKHHQLNASETKCWQLHLILN